MIGDIITIKPAYLQTAKQLLEHMQQELPLEPTQKLVIGIGGESGSGKSVTAMCLQKLLQEQGTQAVVLHLDDYFKKPPLTNHEMRKKNIEVVGKEEIHLDYLQKNILEFLSGAKYIVKPIVHYKANIILEEVIILESIKVVIVEGTYTLALNNLDFKIFMDRTYLETKELRKQRGRDTQDEDFVEKVLEIEHKIIRPYRTKANAFVAIDYSVVDNTK